MRSSDFLFRLIKSLSKGDRRNLKLYGKLQEGDKKYLQLFDAIDAQEEYDETALLAQFKEERFVNQFSVAKNYLYNYILKTLHIFHKDQHSEVGVLQHQVEILIAKNLFDQAYKLLRKVKHLATKQERFQEMLGLLELERKILRMSERTKEYVTFVQDIQREERRTLEKIENLQKYQHVVDGVYQITRSATRDKDAKRKMQEMLQTALLSDKKAPLSFRARLKRLGVLTDMQIFLGDFTKAFEHCSEAVKLFESDPDICIELNERYLTSLANLGVLHYNLGDHQGAISTLNKFRHSKTYSHEEEIRVFEKYYYFKIALCIEVGNIEEGLAAIADFEEQSGRIEGILTKSEEMGINFVSAYFLLSIGKPEIALPWVNKIMNEPRMELRMDVQCLSRIMSLLIHYELGNYDLIEYMAKAATRFITNRGNITQVERITLRYLRKLAALEPHETKQSVLEVFAAELDGVQMDSYERKVLSFLDVKMWIQAQHMGGSMSTIFQKQSEAVRITAS